jgi:hypothetical protein
MVLLRHEGTETEKVEDEEEEEEGKKRRKKKKEKEKILTLRQTNLLHIITNLFHFFPFTWPSK